MCFDGAHISLDALVKVSLVLLSVWISHRRLSHRASLRVTASGLREPRGASIYGLANSRAGLFPGAGSWRTLPSQPRASAHSRAWSRRQAPRPQELIGLALLNSTRRSKRRRQVRSPL